MSHAQQRQGAIVRAGAITSLLRQLARAPTEANEAPPGFQPGRVVGRFELLREVGHGGFGIVYEARDRELGRTVAFKVLRAGALDLREDRLLREAEAAARLSHPNIVTLHDVGRCDEGPYLVLELLHGQPLARRLEQGALPIREAMRIGVEVAKGLAHAHAQGVVHRDLTPGNVFLCDDGQVKVLDFGMAHAFGRRKLEGGTKPFMAPEQLRGAPEDERTDVFAMGVILYQMLTGGLPFTEREALESSTPAPRLDIPDEPTLGAFVARMLEKDPVKRPRDAGEIVAAMTMCQQELARSAAPATGPVRTRRGQTARSRRRAVATLAVLGVLVLIAASVWQLTRRSRGAPADASTLPTEGATTPSIAVLPFANLSDDPKQEYFSDGVAEEILNSLAQVEGLRVVGRTSSFSFKGKNEDLRVIGQRLNVRTVLEGTLRAAGTRLRVSAKLIDVSNGFHLWAASYDREVSDVFAVQDEIAQAVVGALRVKLLSGRSPTGKERRAESTEAYQQYLLGNQLFYRGTDNSARVAAAAYEKAIAIDPLYAPAHAGYAATVVDLEQLAENPPARAEIRRRGMAAAERAVALAPELAEAYSVRGMLRMDWARDWAGARADLERAVALAPGSAREHRRLALFLGGQGFIEQAIASVKKAVDLDPLAGVTWRWLAVLQAVNGRIDLARAAVNRAIEILPESEYAHRELATYALLEGHPSEALAQLPYLNEEGRLGVTALAENQLGHPAEAQHALDQLIRRAASVSAEGIAEVYASWGDRDHAFEWLDRAVREGQVTWPKMSPILRVLRADPRWKALLRKMNLPLD